MVLMVPVTKILEEFTFSGRNNKPMQIIPMYPVPNNKVNLFSDCEVWGFGNNLKGVNTYLLNKSFNSCSEENWPRFATNRVEQGELVVVPGRPAGRPGLEAAPFTA
jgi:hypothetical protein